MTGDRSVTQKLYPSVVLIRTIGGEEESDYGGTGTAWAFSEDHLMTAGHFCQNLTFGVVTKRLSEELQIMHADIQGVSHDIGRATINAYIFNGDEDVCVLDMKDHGLEPLIISRNIDIVETEDPVTIVGAPAGMYPIRRDGYIWAIVDEHLSIAVEVQPGSSGSPVIWSNEVIGMIIRMASGLNEAGLAVRADDLLLFLEEHDIGGF